METAGRIEDLQNAVNRVPGLEWLADMDVDDIELHKLYDQETAPKVKGGRFYILSSNKQATDSLLGLWNQYQAGKKLDTGLGIFKELFTYLLTLRRWNITDRLRDTGILDVWREEYQNKKGSASDMNFEIELHYRTNEEKRNQNIQEIQRKIENAGGSTGQTICNEDIAFHALKATLPVAGIEQVVQHNWDALEPPDNFLPVFSSEEVRYFRPTGQHIDGDNRISEYPLQRALAPVDDQPPVLALLDGAPMLRHNLLDDRIKFFDPDDCMSAYAPSQQKHGTAMACLMCHGDLSRPQAAKMSLKRPIYARPVMQLNQQSGREEIPANTFQEDIIERAVREIFEGDKPAAPGVRVINLSLGNTEQHYLHEMSPWAKLLDWLSFKYNILFIVSAGNYIGSIQTDATDTGLSPDSQSPLFDTEKNSILKAIDKNQRNHRLLAPAESMNALTVGALQNDSFGKLSNNVRGVDPIDNKNLPAPYSRIGLGYRSAIKPDILAQGGRLLYEQDQTNTDIISPIPNNEPPGVQVAYPGTMPEQLNNTAYQAGTSHAAAIVSHAAGHIFEVLEDIRSGHGDIMGAGFDAVLIKALLVHSASWGENKSAYGHLKNATNSRKFKRYISRYLGYGNINLERVLECTRTRATAVGCGSIQEQERHRFAFPLPMGVSIRDYLRLTVTLAWFSPINPHHIGLRRAKLFFEGNGLISKHGHVRQESDWQQVRKGTVQHEIFELDTNNLPGNSLEIFVQCAADAGTLDDEIPYGLAATLEIAEREALDLYQVVRDTIRQQVRPTGG